MSINSVLRAPAPFTKSALRTKDYRPSPRGPLATQAQAVLQATTAAVEVPAPVQASSRLPEAWTAEELDDGSLERELSVLRAYSRHLRTSQHMQEEAGPELSRLEAAKEGSLEREWWRELGYASGDAVAAAYKAGVEASDRLLRANAVWIRGITKPYQGQGLDTEYLINAAGQFYLAAAKDFDPARGTRLSTLAYPYVRQRMARLVNEEATVVREPYLRKKLRLNLLKLQRSLAERSGREHVPPGEVASRAGVSQHRAAELLADDGPRFVSWEGKQPSIGLQKGEDAEATNEDTLEDTGASESARRTWNRRELSDLADELQFCIDSCTSPLERQVLALRYGLEDGQSRSLAEVGRMLDPPLTGERVRQMILAVTKRMRRTSMGSPDLEPYLEEYGVRLPEGLGQQGRRDKSAAMTSFLD